VVVTVITAADVFAVPFAAIVVGVNVQVVSEGRPEHARLIVPLNPVELDTLTDVVPEPPGSEITTADCAEGMAAKKPGVMVKVMGGVLLLVSKLLSPL
jgi:hypothetical protein